MKNEEGSESNKGLVENVPNLSGSGAERGAAVVADRNQLPEEIPYLLIGSGTASYYAALAIRARDADARVLIVGDEKHLPYNRAPLSKELWWYGDDRVSSN